MDSSAGPVVAVARPPAREGSDFLPALAPAIAAMLLLLAVAMGGDAALFERINGFAPRAPGLWEALSVLGLGLSALLITLLMARSHALWLASIAWCFATVGLGVQLIKLLYPMARPLLVLPAASVHVLGAPLQGNNSMPSGHAATVFALATVVLVAGPALFRRVLPAFAVLALALLVAGSRVAVGAHWPSDVAVGALLGWGCALVSIRLAVSSGLAGQLARPEAGRWLALALVACGVALAITPAHAALAHAVQYVLALAAIAAGVMRLVTARRTAFPTGSPRTVSGEGPALRQPLPPHRLSVVVPMYNEAENVRPLIDAVQQALARHPFPWELIVVDDGSTDGTGETLVRHAKAVGPHIRPIRLWRNFRQTAAMQAGIDAARGDVIVTLDGDLQNDPRDVPALVATLLNEDMDLVSGWRAERQDSYWLRKLPSALANGLIRRLTRLPFRDLGCSLKAYRAGVLHQVRLYGEMHRFIPAWMATVTSPQRMAEVPVSHHPRSAGRSKYGLSRSLRVVADLLSVYFFLNFGSRPGHFFGVLGTAVLSAGLAILGYLAALKLQGAPVGGRPLLSLGFFCVIGGLQFITTGVLAEMLIRIYYRHAPPAQPYYAAEREPLAADAGWHASP